MPWLATTQNGSGTTGTASLIYRKPANVADGSEMFVTMPEGVRGVAENRPSWAQTVGRDEARAYGVGGWTDNIVFTEHFAALRLGILPPPQPIISGAGAGYSIGLTPSGTGITGSCVGYLAWYDSLHNRWSPLSGASPVIALANQGRSWTNLPTDPDDASVTHIGLFVSMDGAEPRLAVIRDLGTTAVTESIATGALGQVGDEFERFPRCRYNVIYHDRHVMAGDDRHKDRLYFSNLEQYEQYAGFFLRTRRGEPIVGLVSVRDFLIVLCPRSSYVVQGFTEDDIRMDSLEPNIGSIGHHTTTLAHNLAFIWSHKGPYVSPGTSLHFIGQEFQDTWREEYRAHQDDYERSFAVNDEEANVVKFYAGQIDYVEARYPWMQDDTKNCYWVLDYTNTIPELGGNYRPPSLCFFVRSRRDECAAMLANPGAKRSDLYTGSCDGMMRAENVDTDFDDDGDAFGKRLRIMFAHNFFDSPGGSESDGNTYPTFWLYRVHDTQQSTLRLRVGDEKAEFSASPSYTVTVDSEALQIDGVNAVPSSVFYCEPHISGRGITVDWEVVAPEQDCECSGYGGTRTPGQNVRELAEFIEDE